MHRVSAYLAAWPRAEIRFPVHSSAWQTMSLEEPRVSNSLHIASSCSIFLSAFLQGQLQLRTDLRTMPLLLHRSGPVVVPGANLLQSNLKKQKHLMPCRSKALSARSRWLSCGRGCLVRAAAGDVVASGGEDDKDKFALVSLPYAQSFIELCSFIQSWPACSKSFAPHTSPALCRT